MYHEQAVSKRFGRLVFNDEAMAERLNKAAHKKLQEVITDRKKDLTPELADQVAHAMKEWAMSHGATHFTHWFQPMRGVTAEKHDAFLTIEHGRPLERFSGAQLIQSEPDASSFPSGGMRSTFEARGYTAWDPSSPAFIMKGANAATLVIPSVYLSYTGEVLDLKTPLLRSLALVESLAHKVLKKFSTRAPQYVRVTVGPEQEYFLIKKEFYEDRPDLLMTGRTLQGAPSPKLQQFEDHYFGAIKPNVLAFMEDVDELLAERGIPFKTRHNEVAPNQFELAPTFTEANLAIDQNLQAMEILEQIADRHGFALLLHEKPFAGINGSGKHLNWSLQDADGANLLEPGEAPKRNIQFLVFLSALLLGVHKYGGLLRAAVADAGNDHRLGANEAPPAIMSVFIGGYISRVLDAIVQGKEVEDLKEASLDLRVRHLPGVTIDTTDRNRTSPVAFTGNKFEFRAVGSSHNISEATTALNLLCAYGLEVMIDKIDRYLEPGNDIREAALQAVKEALAESNDILFEGNNYADDWHAEAAKRGLPAARNTPEALRTYLQQEIIDLYSRHDILTEGEIHARVEIKREQYVKIKLMELNVLMRIVRVRIKPALLRYLDTVGRAAAAVGSGRKAGKLVEADIDMLADLLARLDEALAASEEVLIKVADAGDLAAQGDILGDEGCSALEQLRAVADMIEVEISSDLWRLPKYNNMLHLI